MNIIKSGRGSIWNPAGFFGFQFRISAFTAESITFCITAAMCIITGYIDGSSGTFAVLIVGTVVCFAVDVNGFTSTTGISSICCRIFFLIAETLGRAMNKKLFVYAGPEHKHEAQKPEVLTF